MPEIDLPPQQYASLLVAIQAAIGRRYGCLAVGGEGVPTVSRAAVAFVASGEGKYLVTAKHVLDGLWKKAALLRVLRPTRPNEPSIPDEHVVDRSALVWCSHSLDVAVLRAPATMATSSDVAWFSADRGRRQLTKLRQEWSPDVPSHLLFASGFPNFGRIAGALNPGLVAEFLGMLTLPAAIVDLKEALGGSQMAIELTHTEPILASDADPVSRAFFRVLVENPAATSVDLDGLSGGPLVLPAENGDAEIVGVISEGSIMQVEGEGPISLLRAAPIDELTFPA